MNQSINTDLKSDCKQPLRIGIIRALSYAEPTDDQHNDSINNPNDSITQFKQMASINSETTEGSKKVKSNDDTTKEETVCCESCQIKANSRKQYDMTRCVLCMVWFHDTCVGIGKDEPIGLWLCPICRDIPQIIKSDVITLKNDVKQLKECTDSILFTVNGLSTKLDNCIGGLQDQLTALSKQINTKDKNLTDSVETLKTTTNNVKSAYDQKSNQILNKTNTIIEKVKSQTEIIKTKITNQKHQQRMKVPSQTAIPFEETSM